MGATTDMFSGMGLTFPGASQASGAGSAIGPDHGNLL